MAAGSDRTCIGSTAGFATCSSSACQRSMIRAVNLAELRDDNQTVSLAQVRPLPFRPVARAGF